MAMLNNQIVYLYVCFQLCCESLLISHLPAECKVLDKILRPVPFQRKHFPPWSSALEVAALLQTAWGIKCETSTEIFFWDSFWQLVAASFEKLLAGSIGVAFLWPTAGSVWCLWGSLWSDDIGRRWFCSSFQSIGIQNIGTYAEILAKNACLPAPHFPILELYNLWVIFWLLEMPRLGLLVDLRSSACGMSAVFRKAVLWVLWWWRKHVRGIEVLVWRCQYECSCFDQWLWLIIGHILSCFGRLVFICFFR